MESNENVGKINGTSVNARFLMILQLRIISIVVFYRLYSKGVRECNTVL